MTRPPPVPADDFRQRVEPHAAALLRFARRLTRPADAEDVLHDALVAALGAHHRFDPESSFKAWIYGFVTRQALNANRRAGRAAARPLVDEPAAEDPQETVERELAYEAVLADPDAVLRALDAPLGSALEHLSPRMRAAFLLRCLAGFDCREIGAVLDVPKGTVVSWLSRARARLRAELADYARGRGWTEGVS